MISPETGQGPAVRVFPPGDNDTILWYRAGQGTRRDVIRSLPALLPAKWYRAELERKYRSIRRGENWPDATAQRLLTKAVGLKFPPVVRSLLFA